MTQWNNCPECTAKLVKDDENRPTCPNGHFTKYRTPVATTLAFIRNNDEYLIIQRAKEPQKGWWDLPGGFVESNETAYQAMLREIEEETQLKGLTLLQTLGTYPSDYGGIEHTLASGFVFEVDNRDVVLSEENPAYKWVTLEEIPELAFIDCRLALAELKAKITT